MKTVLWFAAIAGAAALCGCFSRYTETETYDLISPMARRGDLVRMGIFRDFTAVDLNWQYQKEGGAVVVDPYRSWVQSPELMLRRYLLTTFASVADGAPAVLDCTLFEYRADVSEGICRLGVEYTLRLPDAAAETGSFRAGEKFDPAQPETIVLAFSRAADKFADAVAARLNARKETAPRKATKDQK